ncbi:MAG: site-specific DNA-methyltransferase [Bacteroidaceae bacterium]|nr:site-specific DNA-methyltransferase [Bacteroidaceae bacterium]
MIEPNTIHCGDCLDFMPQIAEKNVDMVLCDLPYGTTSCKWDVVIPFDQLWSQYKRICKPNAAIVLFGKQPFTSHLILSNQDWFRYEMIWEKTRVGNSMQLGKQPAAIHENILVFYDKTPVFNDQKFKVEEKYIDKRKSIRDSYYKSEHYSGVMKRKADDGWRHAQSVLPFNSVWHKDMHPCEKPVELLQYLIRTYTNENDVILDNTMGSGSTIVAAIRDKRRYIGIEKDEHYFEVAEERINNILKQPTLF